MKSAAEGLKVRKLGNGLPSASEAESVKAFLLESKKADATERIKILPAGFVEETIGRFT